MPLLHNTTTRPWLHAGISASRVVVGEFTDRIATSLYRSLSRAEGAGLAEWTRPFALTTLVPPRRFSQWHVDFR